MLGKMHKPENTRTLDIVQPVVETTWANLCYSTGVCRCSMIRGGLTRGSTMGTLVATKGWK
jgi:hypothetical protein